MAPSSNSFAATREANRTLAYQDKLPKLPVPPLQETCNRYLRALEALQDEKEHAATRAAVAEFLETDGPKLDEVLREYAQDKDRCVSYVRSFHTASDLPDSYIEEFWYESYLSHSDPVVLALNPFFVLEYVP
jgi:carnitine O-acetyltransferase